MDSIYAKVNVLILELVVISIIAAVMFSIQGDSLVSAIIAASACAFSLISIILDLLELRKNKDIQVSDDDSN